MTRRQLLGGCVGTAATVLTGCAAGGSTHPTAERPSFAAPTGAQTLAQLGFTHGPRNFAVPAGVAITRRIDQDNVVTMMVGRADGTLIVAFLREHLTGWGWQLTGQSDDSLTFAQPGWDGAVTVSSQIAGLTLRVVPE